LSASPCKVHQGLPATRHRAPAAQPDPGRDQGLGRGAHARAAQQGGRGASSLRYNRARARGQRGAKIIRNKIIIALSNTW